MNTLTKTLLVSSVLALAYPAIAGGPASAPRYMQQEMTREQHMQFEEERFNAMDANKDGKISAEERTAQRPGRGMGPGASMPAEMSHEEHMKWAQARFDEMDANKDGKINAEDRAARRAARGMGGGAAGPDVITRKQHLKYAQEHFNAMDANKDGKLTRAERRAYHDGKGGMRGGWDCYMDGRGPGPRAGMGPQGAASAVR